MARFYLDNDVPLLLSRLLNEHGNDSTTARQEGSAGYRDNEHLFFAASIERILLTHDRRDFVELNHAWLGWTRAWSVNELHSGTIVIPQEATWNIREMAGEVESIVELAGRMSNRLFYWMLETGWIEERHDQQPPPSTVAR